MNLDSSNLVTSQPPHTRPPCFGSTYHTHMPSQWGSQALGLNISLALATHLSLGLSKLLSHDLTRRRTQHLSSSSFRSTPFRAPPPPFLSPGPFTPDFPADPVLWLVGRVREKQKTLWDRRRLDDDLP